MSGEFSYKPKSVKWTGICVNGKRQSPIHINSANADTSYPLEILINHADFKPTHATYSHNHHSFSVVFQYPADKHPFISLNSEEGIVDKYLPYQFHIHFPSVNTPFGSEHTIDYFVRNAGEVHLVHYNTKYESLSEAKKHKDGILVVASILRETNELNYENEFIRKLAYKTTYNRSILNDLFINTFAYVDLIPPIYPDLDVFVYDGSLTTPGCEEVVKWVICKQPLYVTRDTMDVFIINEESGNYGNIRPTQPTNDRPIYQAKIRISDMDEDESFQIIKSPLTHNKKLMNAFKSNKKNPENIIIDNYPAI